MLDKRARQFGAQGRVNYADRLIRLVQECDSRCNWCHIKVDFDVPKRKRLPPGAATIDHIVPLSLGGTGYVENLTVACYACNKLRAMIDGLDGGVRVTQVRGYAIQVGRQWALDQFPKAA